MAKNLKGGYKIVSLNGLDLLGESLAIEGLYDKLAKSYDKPILVTGIVIDGEKKKNAFVQVEVLDDGIKINDLYGYDLLVEEDGDITVSANPQELPNTADASAGQVLKLDSQKKPVWGAIEKGTKLYKHTLSGSGLVFKKLIRIDGTSGVSAIDTSVSNPTVIAISTSSATIDSDNKMVDVLVLYIIFEGGREFAPLTKGTGAGYTSYSFMAPNGNYIEFGHNTDFIDYSNVTDTVTEL